MPVYVFECEDCKKVEDRMLEVNKREEKQICECGKEMIRIYSGVSNSIKFNCYGFHCTDYKN